MDLFLDHQPEKTAMASIARMDSNADGWDLQVLQEAYRQLPFLSEFDVKVFITRQIPEQGFAIGYVAVKNPTHRTPGQELVGEAVNHARVPVIIRSFQLAPLDLFLKGGRSYPLTEGRFRQAMFRAEQFDAVRVAPPQKILGSDLMPPFTGQQGGYFGNAAVMEKDSAATDIAKLHREHPEVSPNDWLDSEGYKKKIKPHLEKESGVEPLLKLLAPFMETETVEKVASIVAEDPTLQARFRASPLAAEALGHIAGSSMIKKASAGDIWESLAARIRPNTVQLEKRSDGGYNIKWANADMFQPQMEEGLPPDQAGEIMGSEEELEEMEPGDAATMSTDAEGGGQSMTEQEVQPITEFGEWKVNTLDGRTVLGWVFPSLMNFDSSPVPLALFTNGSEFGLQEAIVGSRVGMGANLPHCLPEGYGCLYYVSEGVARAMIPITITGSSEAPDGTPAYHAETDLGEQVTFYFAPGLRTVEAIGEGEYVVPDYFGFLQINGALIKLAGDEESFGKVAEALEVRRSGQVVSDGMVYSLRGGAFEKLAKPLYEFVDRNHAEFMLVSAGLLPDVAREKLAEAATNKSGAASLSGLRDIVPLAEWYADSVKTAEEIHDSLQEAGLEARLLIKEAAEISSGDATTVDAVLSLGFLTPETTAVFVSYLPYFEDTVNRLADLLLQVRLGGKVLNENSVRTALFSLEEVVNGLKLLSQAT